VSQHVVFWYVCVFACAWQINTKKDRENVLVYAYTREHVSARAFSLTLMRAYARECQRERERRCVISDSKTHRLKDTNIHIYTYENRRKRRPKLQRCGRQAPRYVCVRVRVI